MCQDSSTRQSARLTVVPAFLAASSAKPHCVGSAIRPCVDIEPSEMMPMPYLPASVMPDGEICEATTNGISSCSGSNLQRGVVHREPVALGGDALAVEQPADDRDRLVLAVALRHRIDAERVRVGSQRTRAGAEDGAAAGHLVELHHALRDVVGMVIGQRHHAGAELDALGALAGGGQEHFRRGDHFPARGMVLAAPEFVDSRARRAARRNRGRGGIAASDARRSDDAGRGRLRISGAPWGFLSGIYCSLGLLGGQTTGWAGPRQSREARRQRMVVVQVWLTYRRPELAPPPGPAEPR